MLFQGKNIVDACKSENIKHLVYSGLESIQDAFGKACPPFDYKAKVENYIQDQGTQLLLLLLLLLLYRYHYHYQVPYFQSFQFFFHAFSSILITCGRMGERSFGNSATPNPAGCRAKWQRSVPWGQIVKVMKVF